MFQSLLSIRTLYALDGETYCDYDDSSNNKLAVKFLTGFFKHKNRIGTVKEFLRYVPEISLCLKG